MTDKELRKLSRLELLELLLKESRENQMLREELDKLKSEKSIEKTTAQLQETAVQFGASLQNADALIRTLQRLIAADNSTEDTEGDADNYTEEAEENAADYTPKVKTSVDVDLYRRLMLFYSQDIANLEHLPSALHIDVAVRLAQLLKK